MSEEYAHVIKRQDCHCIASTDMLSSYVFNLCEPLRCTSSFHHALPGSRWDWQFLRREMRKDEVDKAPKASELEPWHPTTEQQHVKPNRSQSHQDLSVHLSPQRLRDRERQALRTCIPLIISVPHIRCYCVVKMFPSISCIFFCCLYSGSLTDTLSLKVFWLNVRGNW